MNNVLIDERILKDIAHMLNCLPNQRFNDLNGMVTSTYTIAGRLGRVIRDKNPTGLDVYTLGDNDQPTTCPKCGSRTSFVELSKAIQHHGCHNKDCGYEFALEVDPDAETGNPIDNIDWELLKCQKKRLVDLANFSTTADLDAEALDGITHLLDSLQDYAVDVLGIPEDKVYLKEKETPVAKQVNPQKVELEGPYECPNCGGHISLDATYLEQVKDEIVCPYCGILYYVPEPE